jgi:hypothetical protein
MGLHPGRSGRLRRHYRGERIILTEEQARRLLRLGAVGQEPPPPRGATGGDF